MAAKRCIILISGLALAMGAAPKYPEENLYLDTNTGQPLYGDDNYDDYDNGLDHLINETEDNSVSTSNGAYEEYDGSNEIKTLRQAEEYDEAFRREVLFSAIHCVIGYQLKNLPPSFNYTRKQRFLSIAQKAIDECMKS